MPKTERLNGGHRDRMRERIAGSPAEKLLPHEVLEYLLYQVVPQRDTNRLAHELINRFGSFSAVLNAPCETLEEFPYISHAGALYLKSIPKIFQFYNVDRAKHSLQLLKFSQVLAFCTSLLRNNPKEEIILVCQNAKGEILTTTTLSEGSPNSAMFPFREAISMALAQNASGILLAHSHPQGKAYPTPEDERITQQLFETALSLDISLMEHLIIGPEDYYSFFQSGKLSEYRNAFYLKYNVRKVSQSKGEIEND